MKTKPGKQAANGPPSDRTAELEEKIRAEFGDGPEDYSHADWVSLREQRRLPLLYPGCHVAFRDHYDGEHRGRRLVLREVLYASRSARKVQRYLDQLPDDEIRGVFMDYAEKPLRIAKTRARSQRHRSS